MPHETSTVARTQLYLVPKELVKVAAPITTKSIAAFPVVMASLALEQGNVDVDGGLASALLDSSATVSSAFSNPTPTEKGIFEAELLNDFSHVALDLFTFFGYPTSHQSTAIKTIKK